MYSDAADLKAFYQSPIGRVTRRILARKILAHWQDFRGLSVAGVGHAAPFLRPFLNEAACVAAICPQGQGVVPWPTEGPHVSVLADESHLPFADLSFDRVLMVHCLEHTEVSKQFLREIWRVLKPEGRVMVIVPNRSGLWAQADATPFGHGRPFSRGQIEKLLLNALFTPGQVSPALFMPPVRMRAIMASAAAWERAGAHICPMFAGVLVAEAVKQVYAGLPAANARRAPARFAIIHERTGSKRVAAPSAKKRPAHQ